MFGFEAINNDNSVIVSNTNSHLIFSERGTVDVRNNSVVDRPAVGTATFTTPVLTIAPPKVFARLVSSRHSSMTIYTALIGSPGNWTGFRIYAAARGGGILPLYVVDWVCCKNFDRPTTADYGFALYDENGVEIFSSDKKLVKYSKFTKSWTVARTLSGSLFYYTWTPTDILISPDDYIDITSINRGMVSQFVDLKQFTSLIIYRDNSPTLLLQTQAGTSQSSPQQTDIRKFCMPICKFPTSIYFNE